MKPILSVEQKKSHQLIKPGGWTTLKINGIKEFVVPTGYYVIHFAFTAKLRLNSKSYIKHKFVRDNAPGTVLDNETDIQTWSSITTREFAGNNGQPMFIEFPMYNQVYVSVYPMYVENVIFKIYE